MSKKQSSGGKSAKSGQKQGGVKQQFARGAPMSRRPPRQPGRLEPGTRASSQFRMLSFEFRSASVSADLKTDSPRCTRSLHK